MNIFNNDFKDFILYLNQYVVEYIVVGGYAVIIPPYSIEIMTAVKGLDFISTYNNSTIEQVNETPVRIIHLQNLLEAKKAAGRNKDLNDIENLEVN